MISSGGVGDARPLGESPVDIVIPTWNGSELLGRTLDSLSRQSHANFNVIVVDNGSTDDTVDVLERDWPDVSILSLASNAGFAHATNLGIQSGEAELVALLNNDLQLDRTWLAEMVNALRRAPDAWTATGRMLRWKQRDRVDNIGLACSWNGSCWPLGRGEPDGPCYDEPRRVFGPCAGAALYRRSAFELIGYFDPGFFAYSEDADWAFRAQLHGLPCAYVPTAVSYHLGGSTSAKLGGSLFQLRVRNEFSVVIKNYPAPALLVYWPDLLYHLADRLRQGARSGNLGAFWLAMAELLLRIPRLLRLRRAIQRGATAGWADLDRLIAPGRSPLKRLLRR